MRKVQFLLLALGIGVLAWLVHRVGIRALADNLHMVGLGFFAVIACELVIDAFNTLGWRFTIQPKIRPPYWRLYFVRQAGTAVNQVTPTATLGGEMLKAMLLRPAVPINAGLASVIAAKASFVLGQAALILVGLLTVFKRLELDREVKVAAIAGFGLTVVAVLFFVLLQRRGLFASIEALGRKAGLRLAWLSRLVEKTTKLDLQLRSFYREHPGEFVRSIAAHFVAQVVGVLQIYVLLRALGLYADLPTCLAIEAFSLVIDLPLFLVPGKVGLQEGGKVLIFVALGFTAATGLTVAVVLRLNQLAMVAAGLGSLAYFHFLEAPMNAPARMARAD